MTTQEIQQYIEAGIRTKYNSFNIESGEMMTSEGGDGRFLGKVYAQRYSGIPDKEMFFLVIGETEKKIQIIKFGDSECLTPSETDLNLLLLKEMGIKVSED